VLLILTVNLWMVLIAKASCFYWLYGPLSVIKSTVDISHPVCLFKSVPECIPISSYIMREKYFNTIIK